MALAAALLVGLLAATPPARVEPAGQRLEQLPKLADLRKAIVPRGRPLLVHVWALWCSPCKWEFPLQVQLARKAAALGVDVLFLDADRFEDEALVRAFLVKQAALEVARHAQLSVKLDAATWGAVLKKGWKPLLPATFLYGADGHPGPEFPDEYTLKHEPQVLADLEALVKAAPPAVKR